MSHRAMRLVCGAAMVACVLIGAARGWAQDDVPDDEPTFTYITEVSRADVEVFAFLRRFSADQRAAALSLFDDYERECIRAAQKLTRYQQYASGDGLTRMVTRPEKHDHSLAADKAYRTYTRRLKDRLCEDLGALDAAGAFDAAAWVGQRGAWLHCGSYMADLTNAARTAVGDSPIPDGVMEIVGAFEREASRMAAEFREESDSNYAEWKRRDQDPEQPEGWRADWEQEREFRAARRIQRGLKLSLEYRERLRAHLPPAAWPVIDEAIVASVNEEHPLGEHLDRWQSRTNLVEVDMKVVEEVFQRIKDERRESIMRLLETFARAPVENLAQESTSLQQSISAVHNDSWLKVCPSLAEVLPRDVVEKMGCQFLHDPVCPTMPEFDAPETEAESVAWKKDYRKTPAVDIEEDDIRGVARMARLDEHERGSLLELYKAYREQCRVCDWRLQSFRGNYSMWTWKEGGASPEMQKLYAAVFKRHAAVRSASRDELFRSAADLFGPDREPALRLLELWERRNRAMRVAAESDYGCGAADLPRLTGMALGDTPTPESVEVLLERYDRNTAPLMQELIRWEEAKAAFDLQWPEKRQAEDREAYWAAAQDQVDARDGIMIVLGKVSRAIASQIAAALPDGPRVEFERQYYLKGCPGLTEYVELHSSDVDIPHPRGLHAEVARIGTLSPEQRAQFDAVFEGFLTEELRWNKKIFERLCEIEVLPDRRAVYLDDRYQGKVSELLRERGFASRDWTERMVMTMTEEQTRRLSFRYRVLRPVPIPVFDEEQVESR